MNTELSKRQLLIASAVKRVLKPIVKLMLANNLTYTFAIDVIKGLFVEVADKDFSIPNKQQTDSRISLISGVHRKDVRRLRDHQPDIDEVMPDNVSVGSQLVALWNANPKYLNEIGVPKPLPRFAVDNSDESFEGLVRSLTTDIHPRAVLDEWLRLGIATVDDESFVHLTSDMFVPQEGFEEKAFYLGHNLHDHAQAAVSNVIGQQPSFFERCVHYDVLSPSSVDVIAEFAKKHSMKVLRGVNKVADVSSLNDKDAKNAKMRMTYGVYFYAEPMQAEEIKEDRTDG
ncbi:MAG: DUF6502 family protein [Methylotenera sp.]